MTNRKKHRKIIYIGLVLAAFAFMLYSGFKLMNLETKKQQALEELEKLQAKEEELNAELRELDSEEYIEQEARSELHMIKDGEIVYVVTLPEEENKEGNN